jgi:hypothetical protein
MTTIYIADSGDDKNDGLSLQTAIYSLKRAKELHGGRNDCSWHFGPRAWKRIKKELFQQEKGCVEQLLTTTIGQTTSHRGGCANSFRLDSMQLRAG